MINHTQFITVGSSEHTALLTTITTTAQKPTEEVRHQPKLFPTEQHLIVGCSILDHQAIEVEGSMRHLCCHLAHPHGQFRIHHEHHFVEVARVQQLIFTAVARSQQFILQQSTPACRSRLPPAACLHCCRFYPPGPHQLMLQQQSSSQSMQQQETPDCRSRLPSQQLVFSAVVYSHLVPISSCCNNTHHLRPCCDRKHQIVEVACLHSCLLYTSPSPRDCIVSRMPSSA